jgi:hypothetical protein
MLTILVFEIKEGKNAHRPHVWGHTPPPSPACMLKKALDFVCAFINK